MVPASTYGLDALALSELHQHKPQICENNWIRRIARIKIMERRRMKDPREQVGTKACIVGKIVIRMKRAGYMVRKNDDRQRNKKVAEMRKTTAKKRDLRKAGGRKWRENANNSEQWKNK